MTYFHRDESDDIVAVLYLLTLHFKDRIKVFAIVPNIYFATFMFKLQSFFCHLHPKWVNLSVNYTGCNGKISSHRIRSCKDDQHDFIVLK
jgi:hypothetical protein